MIDGTTCNQNTFDKCVNGICQPTGCDNRLDSNLKLNKCGVCSSYDWMCNHYTETYSTEQIIKLNGYLKRPNTFNLVKIPKGAINIEIIQFGYRGDGNYMGEIKN